MDKIRLLVIEDNTLLRQGFVDMFKDQHTLEVEVSSGNEEKFYKKINRFNPRIVLLDSGLQSQHSFEILEHMVKNYPNIKIVVMSISLSRNEITQFTEAGASGFILKEATMPQFIKSITEAAKGKTVLPLHYSDLLLSRIVNLTLGKGKMDYTESVQITELELELLNLLSEGSSDHHIGEKLSISSDSVKSLIHNIKQNLFIFSLLEPFNDGTTKSQTQDV